MEKKSIVLGKVCLTPQGTYNPQTAYEQLDIIDWKGSSWLVLQEFSGIEPVAGNGYVMLLASKGEQGNPFRYEDFTAGQLAALKGNPGPGLTLSGYFATLEELIDTITQPQPGEAYAVGTEEPFTIYICDGLTGDWIDNGPITGIIGKSAYESYQAGGGTLTEEEFNKAIAGFVTQNDLNELRQSTVDLANPQTITGPKTFTQTPKVGENQIWHAGNQGSGSGLDADKLDGLDSSSFERVYDLGVLNDNNYYFIGLICLDNDNPAAYECLSGQLSFTRSNGNTYFHQLNIYLSKVYNTSFCSYSQEGTVVNIEVVTAKYNNKLYAGITVKENAQFTNNYFIGRRVSREEIVKVNYQHSNGDILNEEIYHSISNTNNLSARIRSQMTIQPFADSKYDLGSSSKKWNTIYAKNIQVDSINGNPIINASVNSVADPARMSLFSTHNIGDIYLDLMDTGKNRTAVPAGRFMELYEAADCECRVSLPGSTLVLYPTMFYKNTEGDKKEIRISTTAGQEYADFLFEYTDSASEAEVTMDISDTPSPYSVHLEVSYLLIKGEGNDSGNND